MAGDFHHVLRRIGAPGREEDDHYLVDDMGFAVQQLGQLRLPGLPRHG